LKGSSFRGFYGKLNYKCGVRSKVIVNVLELIKLDIFIEAYKKCFFRGLNNITIIRFEDLKGVIEDVKLGRYYFKPTQWVVVRRPNRGLIYFAVPSIKDKIVLQVMRDTLGLVLHLLHLNKGYNFCNKWKVKRCINRVLGFANREIGGFFRVDGRFNDFLGGIRVSVILNLVFKKHTFDGGFKSLIYKSLKAGYIVGNVFSIFCKRFREGSPLSPFLFRIILGEFDNYINAVCFNFTLNKSGRIRLKYFRCMDDFLIMMSEGFFLFYSTVELLCLNIIKFFRLELEVFIPFFSLKFIILKNVVNFLGFNILMICSWGGSYLLIYAPILIIIDKLIYNGIGRYLKNGFKYARPKRVTKIIFLKDWEIISRLGSI